MTTLTAGFRELELGASDLSALAEFYGESLGLSVSRTQHQLVVEAGSTTLRFTASRDEHPRYHFAFNIPENQIREAREWLHARVPTVEQNGGDLFSFDSWNAHAVYFFDPQGNLVEFIARHSLSTVSSGPFGSKSVLHVSEIGLVVPDVRAAVRRLQKELGLPHYGTPSDSFAAIGDEHALLIVVEDRRVWFPTVDFHAVAFPVTASLIGTSKRSFKEGPYGIEIG